MITGYELAEYLFSDNEEERYYSETEVNDMIDSAFSEGYLCAQRDFSEKKKSSVTDSAKTGALAGTLVGGTALGGYLAKTARKGLKEVPKEILPEVVEGGFGAMLNGRPLPEQVRKVIAKHPKTAAIIGMGTLGGVTGAGIGSIAGTGLGTGVGVVKKIRRRSERD